MDRADPDVTCRSYTHARRYPWVIGKIGGWQLPTQLTLAQLAAIASTLLLLAGTRPLWAHLPRMGNLLVEIAVPTGAAWGARHLRVEGRTPLRALAGLLSYLARCGRASVRGTTLRQPRERLGGWLVVSPCPGGWPEPGDRPRAGRAGALAGAETATGR